MKDDTFMSAQKRMAVSVIAALTALGLSALSVGAAPDPPAPSGPALSVLIAGSGPDLSHNQVAIESNVRYVSRLLPAAAVTRVLFADGDPKTKSVLYEASDGKDKHRSPQLPSLDGPNVTAQF